jgi:7-cyano-7-deazaguanine synthase in queuosine biosynthesis
MKIARDIGAKCTDQVYKDFLADPGTGRIDLGNNRPNVSRYFQWNGSPVRLPNLSQEVRDLLDFGTFVYIADELDARAATEDGWTRRFEIVFPVFQPDKWTATTGDIAKCLSQLSGDQFEMQFPRRGILPAQRPVRRSVVRGSWDCVCLFSGGLDSFCGASFLLESGKSVLLVAHQAEGITASTQKRMEKVLMDRFPGKVRLIQARVARSLTGSPSIPLPAKTEDSHRPRSFLFLTLATVVASSLGISEIYLPENGMIGLNAPLQVSRLGTLSTRTAHPLFIYRFNRWVNDLGLFSGQILNPYMFMNKTEVLSSASDATRQSFLETNSCAHAGSVRWEGAGPAHCGYCVPCIYRRLAMAPLGIDDALHYRYDVFTSLDSIEPYKGLDAKAVASFASRISQMTSLQIESLLMRNGAFDPEVVSICGPYVTKTFEPWREMLRNWSNEARLSLDQLTDTNTKSILSLSCES